MATSDKRSRQLGNRPGEFALALGIVAVVFLCVPVIGEFVAVPAAAAAMVLGFIGMRRFDTGRSHESRAAIAGLILGAVAATGLAILLAASSMPA